MDKVNLKSLQMDRFKGLSTSSCHAIVERCSCMGGEMSHKQHSSCQTSTAASSTPPTKSKAPRASSVHELSQKVGRSSVARNKRTLWMMSSIVRRAASVVDEEVAALCEKSPFLKSVRNKHFNETDTASSNMSAYSRAESEVAILRRNEIVVGKVLGKGGFAEVFIVDDLNIKDDGEGSTDPMSLRRREFQSKVKTSSGRPAYAIKFLRKKLLRNTREFQHAAIDMAVEFHYLAALNHPNIIRLRGLSHGGATAFGNGKHDAFFLVMDYLQETLEDRIQRWQKRHLLSDPKWMLEQQDQPLQQALPPFRYYHRTLKYALQIADALAYLHEKSIVYRDLKPQNLGFRERDVIQLFDFGLCRELPNASHREKELEDEETFQMSGVGTQRYMASEILTTRRYNLKADVYSWSMVVFEMMTWKKPFAEFTTQEHKFNVAYYGERPRLTISSDVDSAEKQNCSADLGGFFGLMSVSEAATSNSYSISDFAGNSSGNEDKKIESTAHVTTAIEVRKKAASFFVGHWPAGLSELCEAAWAQDVAERLSMQDVLERVSVVFDNYCDNATTEEKAKPMSGSDQVVLTSEISSPRPLQESVEEVGVVLDFPSHFSSAPSLTAHFRRQHLLQQMEYEATKQRERIRSGAAPDDESDTFLEDKQSETSTSLQELTLTSASTTLHDSSSTVVLK